MIRKIIMSEGRLVMWCILHQPASRHHILFTAPEEQFVHSFWYKTSSSYVDHPCFLFHVVLSLPLSFLQVPTYVYNHSLGPMGSSTRVRVRVAKWVRLDKCSWTPRKHPPLLSSPSCPTSRDLPGPTRTLLLHLLLFTEPSRAFRMHHKLQWKNERLFSLVFTCCLTNLDWQILRGMGRKVSLCASVYWVLQRGKKSNSWGIHCFR